ncbi:MAG TPA: hypothetical protein VFC78_17090 [Tepidisphaeraceae bacterium]|nr:hypothetical protein [Tepidisphaeraceae bacterium]
MALCAGQLAWGADPAPAQEQNASQPGPGAPGPQQPTGGAGQQGPRRGPPNPMDMLKNYRDQFEHVDLTDDQMAKIDKFLETAGRNMKALAASKDDESRGQMFQVFRTLNDDVQSILTDHQKQIMRQEQQRKMFDGMTKMYTDPKLKLTDEQQKKVTAILDAARKKAEAAAAGDGSGDPRGQMRAVFQAMGDIRQQVSAILTPEQQAQLPRSGFGGPGGPGGGRGGPGGPGGGPGGPGGGPGGGAGPGGGPGAPAGQ